MIKEVLSRVELTGQVFRDVCYEWEEEIAKYFNVPVRQVFTTTNTPKNNLDQYFRNCIKKIFLTIPSIKHYIWDKRNPVLSQNINLPLSLCFVMRTGELSFCINNNCLPILLDVFNEWEFEELIRRTKDFKIFYVTSRDVYNRVKSKSPSSNVYYMPLSVADKYHSENFMKYRSKNIDVIQFGRKNPILHEYMLKYSSEHKNIDYVYSGENDYVSTIRGSIGEIIEREKFIEIISSAKISLVGCSGIDNAREGTNGIQFVSPRFYESAILGCALIGRYPDNQEFRELNISKYCPNITSYEQFCESLERALNITPEELYSQNHDFIINSLTSQRAKQIERDLREIIYHD